MYKIIVTAEIPTKEDGVNLLMKTTDVKDTVVLSVESVKIAIEISELEKAIARVKELQHFCY